jgi:hypothetical protein
MDADTPLALIVPSDVNDIEPFMLVDSNVVYKLDG